MKRNRQTNGQKLAYTLFSLHRLTCYKYWCLLTYFHRRLLGTNVEGGRSYLGQSTGPCGPGSGCHRGKYLYFSSKFVHFERRWNLLSGLSYAVQLLYTETFL